MFQKNCLRRIGSGGQREREGEQKRKKRRNAFWQDIDGWVYLWNTNTLCVQATTSLDEIVNTFVYLSIVKLPVDVDLSLCDVSCKISDQQRAKTE